VPVTVVGSGIVGLACAMRLAEAGHEVSVVTAEPAAATTSAVAAAIWYPYRALPQNEVTRWAARTFAVFALMADNPATGVRMRAGRELLREPVPEPWWRDAVPALDTVPPAALPPGYAQGWRLTVPVVDMPVHLAWLLRRLDRLGVGVLHRRVDRLDDLPGTVVHCSGLGAVGLARDREMTPVRGQVVVVEQVGLEEWVLDANQPDRPTYVVPRGDTVVLGGTADEGQDDLAVAPATAEDVVRRCTALVPELAGARVLAHRTGLRPVRTAVRLEAAGRVVHCYGHGGAGVTLAYGCADDVVALVG
jgi:D-amino-acid oxidase